MMNGRSEPIHITTSQAPRTLPLDRLERDANGVPFERRLIDGIEVIVHFAELPDEDTTVFRGMPCTTPLRTMIDLASELSAAGIDRMLSDFLERSLLTEEEALARLARDDMLRHPGGPLVVQALARRHR